VVFSFMTGMYHDYYTMALSPAIAAVVGIGVTQLWQHRSRSWVGLTLALVAALTAVWSWVLLDRTPDFVPWLRWVVLVIGVLAAVLLALNTLRGIRFAAWASGLAVAAAAAGPLAYCVQTLATPHNGGIVTAGPSVGGQHMPGPPPGFDKAPSAHLVQLLKTNAGDYTWVAATNGSNEAANYQLASGGAVMPIGGFIGSDPSPTLAQFQQYVADGQVHYFIVSRGPGGPGGPGRPGVPPSMGGKSGTDMPAGQREQTEGTKIAEWVKQNFTASTVDGVTYYDLTAPPTR